MHRPATNEARPTFPERLAMAALNLLVPIHTGLIVAYVLARWLGGRDLWFVDAIGYVLPWLILPSLGLLPLALLRRARVHLALALVPPLVFAATYGHLFLPARTARAAGSAFSAMTYNVLWSNTELEEISLSIEERNPDFVGLQELVPETAAFLRERLAVRYPYHRVDDNCGFWSRYPVLEQQSFRLGWGQGQWAQQFLLDVDGQPMTLLNVPPRYPPMVGYHPFGLPLGIPTGFANEARDTDLRDLVERVARIEGPLVVIGDLNITDQQSLYPAVTSYLRDAHRTAGWGMGFTFTRFVRLGLPMWRIDYVLYSPELVALRTRVGDNGGSDHRPLYAELAFLDAP